MEVGETVRKAPYEELIVWQRAVSLAGTVYAAGRRLPRREGSALADQIRRAAVSVPANIAEGQARQHVKEFIQFLSIARGSLAEVHTLLVVARRLDFIGDEELDGFVRELESVRKPLIGLIQSLKKK